MLEDKALGLTLTDVGKLTSVLPFMYGISKFLSGVLGARISPTYLLSGEASCFPGHPGTIVLSVEVFI